MLLPTPAPARSRLDQGCCFLTTGLLAPLRCSAAPRFPLASRRDPHGHAPCAPLAGSERKAFNNDVRALVESRFGRQPFDLQLETKVFVLEKVGAVFQHFCCAWGCQPGHRGAGCSAQAAMRVRARRQTAASLCWPAHHPAEPPAAPTCSAGRPGRGGPPPPHHQAGARAVAVWCVGSGSSMPQYSHELGQPALQHAPALTPGTPQVAARGIRPDPGRPRAGPTPSASRFFHQQGPNPRPAPLPRAIPALASRLLTGNFDCLPTCFLLR